MARGGKRGGGRGGGGGADRGGQSPRGGGRGRGGRGGRGGFGPRGSGFVDFDDDYVIDQGNVLPQNFGANGFRGGRGRGRGGGARGTPPFSDYGSPRGSGSPRGRGGASTPRGTFASPLRGNGSERGSPRGGRGGMRGRMLEKRLKNTTAPLSQLLYEDRPYLRPIVFVRSTITPSLFMDEEEIFEPVVEETGDDEKKHVPTADAVSRVFRVPEEDDDSDALDEIDFADMGEAVAEIEILAAARPAAAPAAAAPADAFMGFYVDTVGDRAPPKVEERIAVERPAARPLGEEEDDEIIVYVAPHPKIKQPAEPQPTESAPLAPAVSDVVMTSDNLPQVAPASTVTVEEPLSTESALPVPTVPDVIMAPPQEASAVQSEPVQDPVDTAAPTAAPSTQPLTAPAPEPTVADVSFSFSQTTSAGPSTPRRTPHRPRSLLYQRPVGGTGKRRLARHPLFGSFGAALSEARLQSGREKDPRREEQRRGDSDVDWGGGSSDDEEVVEEEGAEGMEVDGEVDVKAMSAFVASMSQTGARHKGAGDVEDEERMRVEDEESEGSNTSAEDDEAEAAVAAEEALLIAEAPDGSDSDEDSSDEDDLDVSPKRGFEARLQKLRAQSRGKTPQAAVDSDSDGERDPDFGIDWDEDIEFGEDLQEYLLENGEILGKGNRKERNKLFRQVFNGKFDAHDIEYAAGPAKRKKDAAKDLPAELAAQWERDRNKKAERKKARELERLLAAADPISPRRAGKKAKKAMRAAARSERELPNQVVDAASLEAQLRRFVSDVGGPGTMALPPMEKRARALVHELALAFGLKSGSKGKGKDRYTSLSKTSRTGVAVKEGQVRAIVRRAGGGVSVVGAGGKGRAGGTARPREGEEVGKEAPKIGASNVGFKMLEAMGWAEGVRIGGETGGLAVPLTAVVKTTKLGLGASYA